MQLPESYVVQKLFSFAHAPSFHRGSGQYNAGCPVCKEGKSNGRKKRLYYYTKTNSFYCFNCNKNWSAFSWVREVAKLSSKEIEQEILNGNYRVDLSSRLFESSKLNNQQTLPYDSINLCDLVQTSHYKNNLHVNAALNLIKERKLDNAINRPSSFFISLKDFVHKNRLCIPFYNSKNEICFYQTRSLDSTTPKYLSKLNAEKQLFGINSIDPNIDYIFIFEGPIDAMFVKNGVAATGLQLTQNQQLELNKYPLHKKIWVLDNQNIDVSAKQKTDSLLLKKESVFIWPAKIPYKDFNELAVALNQNYISHKFILNNTNLF
jgi:hypothetical protein